MKNKIITSIIVGGLVIIASCKKDENNNPDPSPSFGTVNFIFTNIVDGQSLTLADLNYTNEAGNLYSADLLKYYISNISFVLNNNTTYLASNYELIDESVPGSKTFSVQVPYGDYKSLGFFMGVDSIKNVSGAQAGELDPSYGMFWDWNTGYIYFKHEGTFIDINGDTLPIVYHYGSFEALVITEHEVSLKVTGAPRTVNVAFNLNKLYRSPNVVDFNNNNIHSGGSNWVNTLRENFDGAFEVTSVD